MANYTLTYSESVQGFPSFYSFIPEWMIGMNNHFYTFDKGNLYLHNSNNTYNNYYGIQYGSAITSVFNDSVLENKLFKTIDLQGVDAWGTTLETDIQHTGFIELGWYEKKEGSYFAFVRNSGTVPAGTDEYALRSLNGIGSSLSVTGNTSPSPVINFSTAITIGSIISVGDIMYFILPGNNTPILAGKVTAIQVDLPNGINRIVIDRTITGAQTIFVPTSYFLSIKNSVAESHGVLGHYCVFTLQNNVTTSTQLFAVEANVMKSFP
jgi:hypothetical protein